MRCASIVPAALGSIALVLAIGCEAAPAPFPILTDARAALMAGLESTASLRGVHLQLEVGVRLPGGQGKNGQTIDFDVDLESRSFAGRSVFSGEDGAGFSNEIIATGGQHFTRTPPDARWQKIRNVAATGPVPADEELVAMVGAILARDGVEVRLAQPEPCNDSTCYHVVVGLDGDAARDLLGPVVFAGGGGNQPGANFSLPPTTLDAYIDQATRQLIGANTTVVLDGSTVHIAVVLSNHDVPVQVVAPPPGLVNEPGDNLGGVGEPIPAPTAAPLESP